MKLAGQGSRIAVVGASSLLGKELMTVLEERRFPVSRLVTFEGEDEEQALPIVDLRENLQVGVEDKDVKETELDFAFLAANPAEEPATPSFLRDLRSHRESVPAGGNLPPSNGPAGAITGSPAHCVLVDLSGEDVSPAAGKIWSIPSLDCGAMGSEAQRSNYTSGGHFISLHPGAIVISNLLLRLAKRFTLKSAVAQVFGPASQIGPRAIEELQNQTVSLLSFQKTPRKVFGAQMAFNLLPRLGRAPQGKLVDLEACLRTQLREYLGQRVLLPALRLVQTPVFYSLGVSLYAELAERVTSEAAAAALSGERIRLRRASQDAPTQVEVTGSSDILVDAITVDAYHSNGVWIWAVADDLRLAAVNAVEIAESVLKARAV